MSPGDLVISAGLLLVLLCAALSLGVSYLVLRNAEYLQVMATPNARSSHNRPTPSGGGVGIVAGGTLAALSTAMSTPWPTLLVIVAGLVIAAIGFVDDRRPVPFAYRLAAQFALAAMLVALGIPAGQLVQGIGLPLPWAVLALLAVVGTVYWINLFNFMDGIDGLAAGQGAFMLGGAALLAAWANPLLLALPVYWWMLASAAAAAAFLVLNWAPAKIFMGDAGSTFLGLLIAFFGLATIALGWLSLWQWLILAGLFVADATVTLLRRLRLGEQVTLAHRRHAYQRLARRWGSHARATGLYLGINLVWLLPLAALAGDSVGGLLVAVLAYAPLLVMMLRVGAGLPEETLRPTAT